MSVRMPPGLVKAITAPPSASARVAASWASAMISPSALSPAVVGRVRQRFGDRSGPAVGDRRGDFIVGRQQRGLLGILGIDAGADDDVVGLGADDVVGRRNRA